jgi:hypothetical protein
MCQLRSIFFFYEVTESYRCKRDYEHLTKPCKKQNVNHIEIISIHLSSRFGLTTEKTSQIHMGDANNFTCDYLCRNQ